MAVEDFQWTLILGLLGLLVGFILPSGLDILGNVDYTQMSQDPVNFLTGYIVAGTSAVIIEVFSTIIGGLIMGVFGLLIDLFRMGSSQRSYGI